MGIYALAETAKLHRAEIITTLNVLSFAYLGAATLNKTLLLEIAIMPLT